MKQEVKILGRKKPQKGKSRGYFEDEGFYPSKKDIANQYKRRQKHKNSQDWEG